MTWANAYVGIPFKDGGRGPDAFDCWGLVRHVAAERYKIELPDWDILPQLTTEIEATIEAERMADRWHRVGEFGPGTVAILKRSKRRRHHVGIVIEHAELLHALPADGVVVTPMARLERYGYHCEFYQWQGG